MAGYHTEYSSMRFALFFLAEYINMVTVSAVATNLFLGGWHGPFLPESLRLDLVPRQGGGAAASSISGCAGRCRGIRYDQLMAFGWKVLLPAGDRQPARDGGGGAVLWL